MRKPILNVEDLYYVYGNGKAALDGVSVDIYEGEKIAVIGSNGSGKSTFFLNINGVFTPQQGKMIYRGNVVNKKNLKDLRKNIGIVFQDADNQIIASTVRAEVGFGPMNLKLPKEEVIKRVEEALAYMNISDFKDRPPHYLSGGEKKRVTIAGIIAMKSEIIIYDEPTASLDPLNTMMLEEVLAKLSSEGKTMLISTHDVDFAYRWAQRVLVFCQGKIIADGTPLEIFLNTEVLKQANLKQPTMLEVYESLVEKHMLADIKAYPKSTQEFKEMLKK
ncbi:energy-coupling factor ABC transporter ATP-binding protein [Clostridium estertheticum]|uniref:energy-coupling factor ABC transporter ATP-binding protein n=1 Tax=Clostridium estertheticum TaxID=238834 RepID=UPI001C7CEF23|nr:ABC transporter ATP-binding protein [Clostridium estertheticum]MBX4263496.1 energy-coupling factor ABC transporter ATP-binding protein [Clostridium estertheticum]MBX4270009.1 energy-coupling factor ABC transporter ATP-binding protein [Clostridium estertheticum]WLC80220.1 energy-coupling factor ABC transporter ATP-binding protein [Clostridium estertheticum]WLC87330.1 energy-coupling factor ABC transporter ATP-binding protein [Clostridium estertheticum]